MTLPADQNYVKDNVANFPMYAKCPPTSKTTY